MKTPPRQPASPSHTERAAHARQSANSAFGLACKQRKATPGPLHGASEAVLHAIEETRLECRTGLPIQHALGGLDGTALMMVDEHTDGASEIRQRSTAAAFLKTLDENEIDAAERDYVRAMEDWAATDSVATRMELRLEPYAHDLESIEGCAQRWIPTALRPALENSDVVPAKPRPALDQAGGLVWEPGHCTLAQAMMALRMPPLGKGERLHMVPVSHDGRCFARAAADVDLGLEHDRVESRLRLRWLERHDYRERGHTEQAIRALTTALKASVEAHSAAGAGHPVIGPITLAVFKLHLVATESWAPAAPKAPYCADIDTLIDVARRAAPIHPAMHTVAAALAASASHTARVRPRSHVIIDDGTNALVPDTFDQDLRKALAAPPAADTQPEHAASAPAPTRSAPGAGFSL